MKDFLAEQVMKAARYYPRGLPPTREKYAVRWKGKLFVSNDTLDLLEQVKKAEKSPAATEAK